MYIAPVYNTNRAGAISLMFMMYMPAERIPSAWNRPEIVRLPGGILMMVG